MLSSGVRAVVFLSALVLSATATKAQQLPEAPSPMPRLLAPTMANRFDTRAEKPERVADTKFVAMGAVLMAVTISDLERTRHCLARSTCVEMNPMLPHSRVGMYAVNIPINAGTMYLGYKMKAAGWKTWWVLPALNIAGHAVGTGFRF